MHTSQHLLSAVLEHKLDIPTLAWSITSHPSPGYVEIPRGLSAEEIAFVQEECNKLVFEGRSVHVEVEELDAESHAYTGPSVGIPQDYTGGVKRTVVIDGIDRNPCVVSRASTCVRLINELKHPSPQMLWDTRTDVAQPAAVRPPAY